MATITAPPRGRSKSGSAHQRSAALPGVAKRATKVAPAAKKLAAAAPAPRKIGKAAKATAVAVTHGPPGSSTIARKAALKVVKVVARKTLESGVEVVQRAAERSASRINAIEVGVHQQRPPIQRSLDVAVPLAVAWEEWMTLDCLPEGVDRVQDIERSGDGLLTGRIVGRHTRKWEAEILDERDRQSFAWKSIEGSDCAGLVTFHTLTDTLTRIELNLDVVPTSASEAVALATHVADRRAEADVRRFKARVEMISPDTYEDEDEPDDDHDRTPDPDGDQ